MTIKDTYSKLMKGCIDRNIEFDVEGHYQTTIGFCNDYIYINPDGSPVVRYVFRVNGCMKTKKVNGKTYRYHCDRLPVYGRITTNQKFKDFIYKYLLFLKCDGIESKVLMMLYLLKCLKDKFEFYKRDNTGNKWETYDPDYSDMKLMIDGLLGSVMNKEIDDTIRDEFKVETSCVIRPGLKFKGERMRLIKKGQKTANERKIEAVYDETKTDKENAEAAGVGFNTFRRWKAANVESLEDKLKRLYDPNKTNKENAEMVGCSVRKIQDYKKSYKEVDVEVPVIIEENIDEWLDKVIDF